MHRWASLATVERYVPVAAAGGVSAVARSSRGFVAAYRRAGGRWQHLPDAWIVKRENFVTRHLAQARQNGERLRTAEGYSRRGLALLMWAFDSKNLR